MILKFRVEGQTLFPLPTNDIPRKGSRNYLKVDFDFGCGTEAYTKTVYFTAEGEGENAPASTAVVYEGEPIQVEDYFAQKSFSLSVGFVLGNRSYTTNEISVPLDPASDVWLNLPTNLDIPAYQQLVMLAQESRDLAQEATEEAAGATQIARDAADAAASVTGTATAALNKASTAENTANAAAEDADEARRLAEDAEQTAITAISIGNHVIRASTADGIKYVAPKSDTLPAIATGTAGGHRGKGTRIVLIPNGPNTVASPTLKVGDGEVIPIRLRSATNKGDNDQAPDATDDIPVGALMAGVPYAMTFCGKYWLMDSLIGGIGGGKIYVSDTEPEGLKPGDGWVDTSVELENPVTQGQMETYVTDALKFHNTFDDLFVESFLNLKSIDGDGGVRMSVEGTNDGEDQRLILLSERNAPRLCGIGDPTEESDAANKKYVDEAVAQAGGSGGAAATDITDTVDEILMDSSNESVPEEYMVLYLAGMLIERFKTGEYISHGGVGQYDLYWDDTNMMGGIRMRFMSYSIDLTYAESVSTSLAGKLTVLTELGEIVYRVASGDIKAYSITGLAEPTEDSGAANKKYVDDAIAAALAAIPIAEERSYG